MSDAIATTRGAWHAVAEQVLAGPQHRLSGTIRLRVTPGGFATVTNPDLRVDGAHLVVGERRLGLDGARAVDLAAAAGVDAGGPEGVYPPSSGADPDTPLVVSAAAAAVLGEALALGDQALRAFAPAQQPVLWPEHLDVAITVDEINYGVSLGDAHLGEPYAYVGPWQARSGPFWNAPFGATRPVHQLSTVAQLVDFFTKGQSLAAQP